MDVTSIIFDMRKGLEYFYYEVLKTRKLVRVFALRS